jgi:hypothetical protein
MSNLSIVPLSVRIENALVSYVAYTGKAFWPVGLSPYYPFPESLPLGDVVASVIILATITAAVLYARRARYPVVGWLLFVVTLVPVIGIVQVGHQAMADRYSYIPCIGLFLVLAWGLAEIPSAAKFVPAIALCLLLALAVATTRYLRYWQNGVTLFMRARAVAVKPDWLIEEFLADSLLADGQVDAAFRHFRDACVLRPDYAYCHFNMAEILFTRNQLRDALEQYQRARRFSARRDMTVLCLVNSADILLRLGDPKAADMALSLALETDPGNVRALALRQQVH